MNDVLAGRKGWFVWNTAAFGRYGSHNLRGLANMTGARALAVKTYDGAALFSQRIDFAGIHKAFARHPHIAIGAWGYHYGVDLPGELHQVRHALDELGAAFVILNVEDPAIERDPDTAEKWGTGLASLAADYPDAGLYFCSHAQPRYHEQQPYWQATVAGLIHQPMIYHTAMERPPRDAVNVSVAQYRQYSLLTDPTSGEPTPWSAAGAAYGTPGWNIRGQDVATWARAAVAEGATSLLWWSADVAWQNSVLLSAIREIPDPPESTVSVLE